MLDAFFKFNLSEFLEKIIEFHRGKVACDESSAARQRHQKMKTSNEVSVSRQ